MKRIAVLTSGGDAPGMNAAIRAVVRRGVAFGFEVLGIRRGYTGLIAGDFRQLGARDVGGIIERGGTVLGTSRCAEFLSATGQQEGIRQLRDRDVGGLVVIGGDGSQAGAHALSQRGMPVVGVASTIDNDLAGCDVALGAATAIDTALDAIDRLRVTASSHGRTFLVEVMGRSCGYLALVAGIAGGAEAIMLPEAPQSAEDIATAIREAYGRGKSHAIVVVAEGAEPNASALAGYFTQHAERLGFELRTTKLGHIQRGGAPNALDRMNATLLGAAAVEHLRQGTHGVLLGMSGGRVMATAYPDIVGRRKPLPPEFLELARILTQ